MDKTKDQLLSEVYDYLLELSEYPYGIEPYELSQALAKLAEAIEKFKSDI